MAVVDEASVRVTPDVSGFAEELRAEVEAAIDEATAGLDKTVHIKVDVDSQDAAAKMHQAIDDFTNDGRAGFSKLRADEQALFDDIGANAEKSRIKQTDEQTKLRDKIRAVWQPALAKLKQEQIDEKTRLDKITQSAEKAAKAVASQAGGQGSEAAVKAENALTAARKAAEAEATKLADLEGELQKARTAAGTAGEKLAALEERVTESRHTAGDAAQELRDREQELDRLRNDEGATAKKVEAAERDVATARKFSQVANDQLAKGEANLEKARTASEAASTRVSATEEKIRTSRAGSSAETKLAAEAEKVLGDAHRKTGDEETRHVGILERLRGTFARFGDGTTDVGKKLHKFGKDMEGSGIFAGLLKTGITAAGEAVQGFGTFTKLASTTTEGLSGVMTALSGSVMSTVGSLGEGEKGLLNFGKALVTLGAQSMTYLTIGAAVGYVIGAIGAAAAGLPALIDAAAASLAVFALGMDGIKKAYNTGLKPALDQLKKQVSDVFEKTLTPAFKELGSTLIPQVTTSMKGLAQAFADGTVELIHMVDQKDNIAKINDIINNTATEVRGQLTPALKNVVQAFIDIGSQKEVMTAMVGIIADLVNNVADWLHNMQQLNLITPAVQALRDALNTVEEVILQVLTSAVKFFTQVTPGFESLVKGIGNVVSALLDRLGPAFNDIFKAIGDGLKQISPQVWDELRDAVQRVAGVIQRMAADGTLKTFFETAIRLIAMAIDAFGRVIDIVDKVVTALHKFNDAMQPLNDAVAAVLRPLGLWPPQFDKASEAADRGAEAARGAGQKAQESAGFWQTAGSTISGVWDNVRDNVVKGAEQMGGQVAAIAKSFPGKFKEGLDQIGATVSDFFSTLGPQIAQGGRDLATDLGKGLGYAVLAAKNVWDNVIKGFKDFGTAFMAAFHVLFNPAMFVEGLNQLGTALAAAAKNIWDNIVKGLQDFGTHFAEGWRQLTDPGTYTALLSALGTALVAAAKDIWDHIVQGFKDFGTAFMAAFHVLFNPEMFVEGAKEIMNGILAGLKAGASAVIGYVTELAHNIVSGFKSVLGIASPSTVFMAAGQDTMAGAQQGIQAGAPAVVAAASSAAQQTAAGWHAPIMQIAPGTQSAFGDAAENVRGGGGLAAQRATVAGQAVRTNTVTPMQAIPADVTAAMAPIPGIVQAALAQAQAAAQTGGTAISTAIKTSMADIQTAVQTSMTAVGTTITITMTTVRATITTALTGIQTNFTTTFTAIQTANTTFWTQMKTTTQTSLQAIQQNIQQVIQQIVQLVTQTYQQMVQLTQQTWQQLLQIVTNMGNQIVAQCRTIAQQILQVFTDLAPQLEAAGNTMMQRLAAGITAGGAAAVAAAQAVAAQIKAQFPASPAKEGPLSGRGDPLRTGGVIIERLAHGIRDSGYLAIAALGPILAQMTRLFGHAAHAAGSVPKAPVVPSRAPIPTLGSSVSDVITPDMAGTAGISRPASLQALPSHTTPTALSGRPDLTPEALAAAVATAINQCSMKIEDDGRGGMAKIVNRQNRQLSRR